MDIVVVIISVSRDHEAVMLRQSDPPLEGGVDSDGKREASWAREKLPNIPSQKSTSLVS